MESDREFEARSLEEALEKAARRTGVPAAEMRYEILEEAKKGFLGMGSRMVRIRLLDLNAEEERPRQEPRRSVSGRTPHPEADPGRRPSSSANGADDEPYSRHEALREIAGRILGEMHLELRARLRDRDGALVLELSGPDAGLFLEDEGTALEALQHVLNKILTRDPRFGARVVVDCEGFRERHDDALVARARGLAEEARASGNERHVDGLNPYERRLVHLALAELGGVRTFSTGEGHVRRLTIQPIAGGAGSEGP